MQDAVPAVQIGWCLRLLLSLCLSSVLSATQINVDGRGYLELETVGKSFGMRTHWLEKDKIFRLSSQWTTIDVIKSSRLMKINQMPVYLGFPTVESDNRLFIATSDYTHALQTILTPQAFDNPPNVRRIVIDPGHGGKDNGARNDTYGLLEKKLTLDVARRLETLLKKNGFKVFITRKKDLFVPLEQRSAIANRSRGDLFVSLHFNAAASKTASGFETFALTPGNQPSTKNPKVSTEDAKTFPGNKYDPWNMLAAYHMERALTENLLELSRGVKRARFSVLKGLDCPGILVELGFVSHVETAKKLRSTRYRQSIAESVCKGILGYRERLERIR